jgi:hypothetical protein
MNYNEFVCHCVLRLAAVNNPENGKPSISPTGCLNRAFAVADTLVRQGFIEPTLEMFRNKFEVYASVLTEAYEGRTSEQIRQSGRIRRISMEEITEMRKGLYHEDREVRDKTRRLLNQYDEKLALDLSQEVLGLIKNTIEPKRVFYTTANLLLPELGDQIHMLEAGKRGDGEPIAPAIERILNFVDFGREENVNDDGNEEQEAIDNVDSHKEDGAFVEQLHEEFIVISEIEQRVREKLWHVREVASQG